MAPIQFNAWLEFLRAVPIECVFIVVNGFKMQSKQKMKAFQPWSKWASSSAVEIYLDRERAHRLCWSSVLWGSTFPIPEVT